MSEPKYPVERADLTRLPWRALAVVAKAIESGDRKYQAGDWIMAPQRIDGRRDLNSALRHIAEFVEGKNVDEDSGESPLAHAAARLLFLLEREARGIKGGGWRIGQPIVPLATDSDPGSSNFRLPLTPRVCGAVGGDGRGHVALCGLDKGHPWPHRFTVPDITDERPKSTSDEAWDPIADERSLHGALIFCTAFRDIGGKPFLCGLDAGHDGPHSFTVRPHGDDERESVPDDHPSRFRRSRSLCRTTS